MEKKIYELKISEALEHVIPPLQDAELELLETSLRTEGCRDSLIVWNGTIVDGHNRYRICKEYSIPFKYEVMDFEDESAAKKWIIRNQLARRNVPDFVRCELVLPLEDELKADAKRRQIRKPANSVPPNLAEQKKGDSRDEVARIAGVSHGNYSKAKKLMAEADEETKEKLRKGDVSIHRAYTDLKGGDKNPAKAEAPRQSGKPGDIVPGFGVEQILGPRAEEPVIRQPDSVYDIPPIEVYGNAPSDNIEMRATAELVHARSDLKSSTDYYVRRTAEILRGMSTASTNKKNIEVLRDIVSEGYEQIMSLLNQKMNGGNENE